MQLRISAMALSATIDYLKRAVIWISRITHCRGFGVQSPVDYRFVRYVINQHNPYYSYNDLKKRINHSSLTEKRLCKLYFRLANYCQADVYIDCLPPTDAYQQYVHAACAKTRLMSIHRQTDPLALDSEQVVLARLSYGEGVEKIYRQILSMAAEKSVIVIEGIKRDEGAARLWRDVCKESRFAATYDLYDCGVAVILQRRYTMNYIINF